MKLLAAADRWCGVPYGHPQTRRDESVVDCSTLTARVLDEVLPGGLSTSAWLDVVVGSDPFRPWSPIERALEDGWGEALPDGAEAPVWSGVYLLQAWHTIPTRGHAMLAWWNGTTLAVLEATDLRAPDGARYGVRWRGSSARGVAPLDLADAPRLTVEALVGSYPAGLRWARLVGVE